jgi:hypothetical protein
MDLEQGPMTALRIFQHHDQLSSVLDLHPVGGMTLGRAPEQADLLRSTVSFCDSRL